MERRCFVARMEAASRHSDWPRYPVWRLSDSGTFSVRSRCRTKIFQLLVSLTLGEFIAHRLVKFVKGILRAWRTDDE